MAGKVNPKVHTQLVAWAIVCGFYMFLRSSNLVPASVGKFDGNKQFRRQDLSMSAKGAVAKARWTKTIQFQQRELDLPQLPCVDTSICPIYRLQRMLTTVPASPQDPLFCLNLADTITVFTYGQLSYWLKTWVAQIGLDKTKFSLHPLRWGGANWAKQCNIPEDSIKLLGDWRSEAFRCYLDCTLQEHIVAMQQFVQKLYFCNYRHVSRWDSTSPIHCDRSFNAHKSAQSSTDNNNRDNQSESSSTATETSTPAYKRGKQPKQQQPELDLDDDHTRMQKSGNWCKGFSL